MEISEIKTYLKQNKITYKMLSKKSGIPEGSLKNIFCGITKNPRMDTIKAIESALGINKRPISFEDIDPRLKNALIKKGIQPNELEKLNNEQIELLALMAKNLLDKHN